MKQTLQILTGFLCPLVLLAQKYVEPTKPEATEVWEPEPKKISFAQKYNIPSDAIILLGEDFSQWETFKGKEIKWKMKNEVLTVARKTGNIRTKKKFGSIQLHLEWHSPEKIEGEGQHRGNSGVFLQGLYEIQVLNSYNNRTYSNGQAGAIYKQNPPLVNACKKEGEWQTYDIIFHAPKFGELGEKKKSATITVLHNGVLIQDNTEILGTTEYIGWPKNKPHSKGPIWLQDHDAEVSYRNIWVRELD